ncbi:hypothetical protein F0562_013071 [Nyssa sinensis]|uniref:MRN complex-interacting protein N-terminal domain-containing protein n=1 Tax=Nyssa sinensis TaxID=561372 RepID=A0A5J4ZXX4_9ASTE|nr:hypothetical protein F0562_013071 [Nyssa sinensis]
MSTIFIAVQCCQCSTMQVKQQKKCGNKWTCVVCNQKQSVQKVFAQGFMARDVRKFVQTFNMSRQFAEEQCRDETLVPLSEEIDNQLDPSNHNKRRTDWSEYIDPEDDRDGQVEEERGDVFEPEIMTELPKALFRKPKLNKDSTELDATDSEKLLRPVFSKRNSNRHVISQDKKQRKCQQTTIKGATSKDDEDISRRCEPMTSKGAYKWSTYMTQDNYNNFADKESRKCQQTTAKDVSKWSDYMTQDDNNDLAEKAPWRLRPTTVKGPSKWKDYITGDDDDLQLKSGRDSADHRGERNHDVLENIFNDQRVEEDIHPDFM